MSDIQDFIDNLEAIKNLKSGISGSRIKKLTTFALENIEQEDEIINLIVDYSKTCEVSHKLGSLYIIDSIGRAYLEECNNGVRDITDNNTVGTVQHGLRVLNSHIEDLLGSAILAVPSDTKEKIKDLINIWDRAGLFIKHHLNVVRGKYFASSLDLPRPTSNDASVGAKDGQHIDESRKSNFGNNSNAEKDPQFAAVPEVLTIEPSNFADSVDLQNLASSNTEEQKTALTQLLTFLQNNKVTISQPDSVSSLQTNKPGRSGIVKPQAEPRKMYTSRESRSNNGNNNESYESNGRTNNQRNLTDQQNNMGNTHHLFPSEKNTPSNPHFRPKPVSVDTSVPSDCVKILSRTLFVGAVTSQYTQHDISNLIKPFGEVQSVIMNHGRKHAFVKVYSRGEAQNIIANFNRATTSPLRIRWAVGFGPRSMFDYETGVGLVPLEKLTDADKKWTLTCEWGGTNGAPLVGQMVFEEPDIVVGDGISSKAIDHKMSNNERFGNRNNNNRRNNNNNNNNNYRDNRDNRDNRDSYRDNNNNNNNYNNNNNNQYQQQGYYGGQQQPQPPQMYPGQMMGQMPNQMMGQMPGQMPGHMQGGMPGQMPGHMQGGMPGQMPGHMQGGMPGQMPGHMQGGMPGQMPMYASPPQYGNYNQQQGHPQQHQQPQQQRPMDPNNQVSSLMSYLNQHQPQR